MATARATLRARLAALRAGYEAGWLIYDARLRRPGRVTPELAGVKTWSRAVTTAADADAFAAALTEEAGRRADPDLPLRDWALEQTAAGQNAPLWDRLRALGITHE